MSFNFEDCSTYHYEVSISHPVFSSPNCLSSILTRLRRVTQSSGKSSEVGNFSRSRKNSLLLPQRSKYMLRLCESKTLATLKLHNLGIFNVSMPLLYGEGGKAFPRLQEETMRTNYDHSLFAWNHNFSNTVFGTRFSRREPNVIPHNIMAEPYAMTKRGLQTHLRIFKNYQPILPYTHLAVFRCSS